MNLYDHGQAEQILERAARRIHSQLASLDASAAAVGEMSLAKADGKFASLLEAILRQAVTMFDAPQLIRAACDELGYVKPPDEEPSDIAGELG